MKIDLSDKTALVTGSTMGIGFAVAVGLTRTGATVVVNGRKQEAVDKAIAALRETVADAKVEGVAADLGTAEGVSAMTAALPAVDLLVNNLGIFNPQPFFEIPDEEWERFFQVNVMSGVRLSRAYAPGMGERGWGRIVFVSSESAINIPVEMVHYGFTKTAQLAIARGLAKTLAGTGVTVNSVLPGPTLSEGVAEMLKAETATTGKSLEEAGADFVNANRPSSIIRRAAKVEEVANMVVYACSKEASATTGAALRVDGGVVDTI